ncbi:uncharacterized protein LOC6575967 [Drosophila mojavensis]|uniref:Uncharacterized protein n=1 Tax=Drosophila mojavensis TaxID=7230 RepID=B4KJ51_DROMO|nr:uncharacterized protein LOC6575967 [Drosophila mojavensis]EDW11413.2 uncharacterized protein Dmoj_GI17129 [Drosophila mojavensis]
MWQSLLLFLLASSVCGAAQRKVDHIKVLYEDNDSSKESDDDYYNDSNNDNNGNSQRDSLSVDIDIDYARQRLIPSYSSYRSASASSTTPPIAHLRRVPRHPWVLPRLGNDNRLDASAAFDEEGYQSDQAPGSMTAQKLQEVGTPEAVQLSRRRYQDQIRIRTNELNNLARLHEKSMENEPLCKRPQARVIRMMSETSTVYSPRATVLHRCDENSSCCSSNEVWAVKNQTTVDKVFFMRSIHSRHSKATIVSMTNHTECHCINRPAQRRKRSSQCECPKHFINFAMTPSGASSSSSSSPSTTSRCRCDCHLSNITCQRMKNGDEGFAVSELKCIRSNECSPPICSYGVFNLNIGRCPRSTQSQPRQLGFG